MRNLTLEEARGYYNRFGIKQDSQAFYEDCAFKALVSNAAFQNAQSVFEFGCGTGRFALDLLQHHLPATARYRGVDISGTMVDLAAKRLAPFGPRATVSLSLGESALPQDDASVDRFLSTYVFDLLSEETLRQAVAEARRVLRPNGLLCLAGITHGVTPLSRVVMKVWQQLFARNPSWVGGCRPFRATEYLAAASWAIRFHTVVVAWGIASEVIIASPLGQAMHA